MNYDMKFFPHAKGISSGLLGDRMQTSATRKGSIPEVLRFYSISPGLFMVGNKIGDLIASQHWRNFMVSGDSREGKELLSRLRSDNPDVRRDARLHLRHLKARVTDGKTTPLTEVFDSPFLRMLRNGSPWLTGREQRKLMQVYIDLAGECFAYLYADGKRAGAKDVPDTWIPVSPPAVLETPRPGSKDNSFYVSSDDGKEKVSPEHMFWMKSPNPEDPYGRGLGIGTVLGDEIEIGEYSSRYIKLFYENDATPPVVVTSPVMSEVQRARNETRWLSALRGLRNRFLPFFMALPKEGKIHQLGASFKEQDVVGLRTHERDVIISTFGMSPEVFGILTASNRATTTEARQIVNDGVVVPRMEMWRESYQRIVDRGGSGMSVVDYEDPSPKDADRASRAARSFPWALTVDEAREMLGQEPVGGDTGSYHVIPVNMRVVTSLEEIANEEPGQVATPTNEPPGREEDED